ncbi:MAG: glycosyltransferase family 2 protein [Bacteroides sp.]|nr:glycosyltransferase family 2 protein [Bacteroides sp.]
MNNNMPLVSIIVPAYNAEKTITETIESILRQTYINFELILVNDGSTDNTLAIMQEISKKDVRIKILDKVNTGLEDSRFYAVERSEGKYIQYIDADDTMQPEAIERLVRKAEQTDADIVIAPFYLTDTENKTYLCNKQEEDIISSEEAIDRLFDEKIYKCIWSKMIKRKLYDNKFDKLNIFFGEDYVHSLQALRYAKTVAFIDYPIINYNYNLKSGSHHTKITGKNFEDFLVYSEYIIDYIKNNNKERADKRLINYIKYNIKTAINQDNIKVAEKWQKELVEIKSRNKEEIKKLKKDLKEMMLFYRISPRLWRWYVNNRVKGK